MSRQQFVHALDRMIGNAFEISCALGAQLLTGSSLL